MDVRVEARPLTAAADLMESKTIVEIIQDVVINSPIVSRFSLTPVISVGGNSISAINPRVLVGGIKATA